MLISVETVLCSKETLKITAMMEMTSMGMAVIRTELLKQAIYAKEVILPRGMTVKKFEEMDLSLYLRMACEMTKTLKTEMGVARNVR